MHLPTGGKVLLCLTGISDLITLFLFGPRGTPNIASGFELIAEANKTVLHEHVEEPTSKKHHIGWHVGKRTRLSVPPIFD